MKILKSIFATFFVLFLSSYALDDKKPQPLYNEQYVIVDKSCLNAKQLVKQLGQFEDEKVVYSNDSSSAVIYGGFQLPRAEHDYGKVTYQIEVSFKDYKYRYRFVNVIHQGSEKIKFPAGGALISETPEFRGLISIKHWKEIRLLSIEELKEVELRLRTYLAGEVKNEW